MKSIFKILVLGVVPILMATAVVDQGLAADKGSQLIFQSNMAHQELHLRGERQPGSRRGYGAGSVLQQRSGDGGLVSEGDSPKAKQPFWSTPSTT